VPETVTEGSGEAWVLRDGQIVRGSWSKDNEDDDTSFTANGKKIPLRPGQTWVELVPTGRTVTVQP
jgi:hypothetical protein